MIWFRLTLFSLLALTSLTPAQAAFPVGVARVDITPSYPVRLSGFGFRRAESEGITHRIWAKALALGDDKQGPVLLITVDNLGVSDDLVSELANRLNKKAGLPRERLTVTATHTHTAPMLTGVAPTLFGRPISPEHQAHIDRCPGGPQARPAQLGHRQGGLCSQPPHPGRACRS
jgi:hypothetical protein